MRRAALVLLALALVACGGSVSPLPPCGSSDGGDVDAPAGDAGDVDASPTLHEWCCLSDLPCGPGAASCDLDAGTCVLFDGGATEHVVRCP